MKWKEFKDTIEKKYGVKADTEIRWIDSDTYATGETLASEPEPDCLSPQHVKTRLQEIIKAIKDNKDIDVPESEIRELQHFFNERSTAFLQAARSEIEMNKARKRLRRGCMRG